MLIIDLLLIIGGAWLLWRCAGWLADLLVQRPEEEDKDDKTDIRWL